MYTSDICHEPHELSRFCLLQGPAAVLSRTNSGFNSPTSQFDDLRTWFNVIGDGGGVVFQNFDLCVRQVVFLQISNLLEQLQTTLIVQEHGGKRFLLAIAWIKSFPYLLDQGRTELVLANVEN